MRLQVLPGVRDFFAEDLAKGYSDPEPIAVALDAPHRLGIGERDVIVGSDEWANGVVVAKDVASGDETRVRADALW